MRKIFSLLLFVVLFSCSNDESNPVDPLTPPTGTPPPSETKSKIPVSSLMKPAIRNINSSSPTGKTVEVRKRVIKSIRFRNQKVNTNYKYNITIDIADYNNLPTDNLYDSNEDALNKDNENMDYILDYLYNTNNQLIDIKNVFAQDGVVPEEFNFQYGADGKLTDILTTYTYGGKYTYNTNALIDKEIDANGKIRFAYEYDSLGRITNSYYYSVGDNSLIMHYTYDYPDNETYIKSWYAVNPTDGTETKTSYIIYKYDSSKPGIYNKEPLYRLENKYLHVIQITSYVLYQGEFIPQFEVRPKYFYDPDGYLIKYDSAGLNYPGDITRYIYE